MLIWILISIKIQTIWLCLFWFMWSRCKVIF